MEKLRGYEKANEDIVNALAVSNAEMITLAQELNGDKSEIVRSANKSANKSGTKASKFAFNNENSEIVKHHYDDTSFQINQAKSRYM